MSNENGNGTTLKNWIVILSFVGTACMAGAGWVWGQSQVRHDVDNNTKQVEKNTQDVVAHDKALIEHSIYIPQIQDDIRDIAVEQMAQRKLLQEIKTDLDRRNP